MLDVVLYGLFKITKTIVSIAKIAISTSFSRFVAYFFGNAKMLVVVLYGLFKITQTPVRNAKISISTFFSRFGAYFFGNAKMWLWYFMACLKSPRLRLHC